MSSVQRISSSVRMRLRSMSANFALMVGHSSPNNSGPRGNTFPFLSMATKSPACAPSGKRTGFKNGFRFLFRLLGIGWSALLSAATLARSHGAGKGVAVPPEMWNALFFWVTPRQVCLWVYSSSIGWWSKLIRGPSSCSCHPSCLKYMSCFWGAGPPLRA